MSLRARKPLVVLFAVGALALSALMVYSFGGRDIFARHDTFLIYFGDTLNGLEPGSLVKFKGVTIGYVDSIRLNYRESAADRRMPVLIQLNADRLQSSLGVLDDVSDPAVLARLVHRGLRAQIEFESFVTGGMYVELDLYPDVAPPAVAYAPPGLAVIPTVPSQADSGVSELQQTIAWLPTFDFQTEIGHAGNYLDDLTTKIAVIPYAEYREHLTHALEPAANLNVRGFQRQLSDFMARLDENEAAIVTAKDQFSGASQDFVQTNVEARSTRGRIDG